MTWAQMGCNPAETERRQAVVKRMNKLWDKHNSAEDKATRMKLERELDRMRRQEAPWLKHVAYWLY